MNTSRYSLCPGCDYFKVVIASELEYYHEMVAQNLILHPCEATVSEWGHNRSCQRQGGCYYHVLFKDGNTSWNIYLEVVSTELLRLLCECCEAFHNLITLSL